MLHILHKFVHFRPMPVLPLLLSLFPKSLQNYRVDFPRSTETPAKMYLLPSGRQKIHFSVQYAYILSGRRFTVWSAEYRAESA